MMERRQILDLAQLAPGESALLVTLVAVSGSSYRRPGAQVLLLPDGRHAGILSGGCLEAEIARKAPWLAREGAVLQRYSTQMDDVSEIPFGLGCGGQIDLLIEPTDTPEFAALLTALRASVDGSPRTVITVLPTSTSPLQRLVLAADSSILFASESLAPTAVQSLISLRRSTSAVFVQPLLPPQRLIVFGAGDDAQPLVNLAATLGWHIIVADGRAQLARAERFPHAHSVVVLTEDHNLAALNLQPADAVVLMTHSYAQDLALLTQLLPVAPRYLALLGARHRTSLLVSQAAAALGLSMEECAERLHAPAGLDLGGDAPASVALAILAEAHARCAGRNAQSLRIHGTQLWQHLEDAIRSGSPPLVCAMDSSASSLASTTPPAED